MTGNRAGLWQAYLRWPRELQIGAPMGLVFVVLMVVGTLSSDHPETVQIAEAPGTTTAVDLTPVAPPPTAVVVPTTLPPPVEPPPTTQAPPPPPPPTVVPPVVEPEPELELAPDRVEAEPEQAGGDCHPSYSPCVPMASDVDCAGGSGDGPAYVDGPVDVVGPDEYHLDADHDGIGCE